MIQRFGKIVLVSVIIPAYNASRFLRQTLESVVRQTHRDLEIIVVDDGSTDNTVRIVEGIQKQDPRVALYRQVNQGAAVARNLGIEKSKGNFIAFLDADDLWHPTKIQKQHDLLLALPQDVGLVYSYCRMIDVDSYIQGYTGANIFKRGWAFHALLVSNFVGNGSTAMVRRKCLPEQNQFDLEQRGNEDFLFYLCMAAKFKVDVVPEFLVGYRWNTSQNNSANLDRQTRSYRQMMKKLSYMYPNIPKRTLRWSKAAFYLSHAQVLFKKGEYNAAAYYLLTEVVVVPSFIFAPPLRRSATLAVKAAYRTICRVPSERRQFLDVDPRVA